MTTSFSSSWKRLASTRQLSLLTLKLEKVSDIPSWTIKKVYLNKVQSEVISKLLFISPQNHLFHYMCFTESPAKPIMNSTALSGTKHLLPWRDSSWWQPAFTLSLTWQTAVHLRFCLFYSFQFYLYGAKTQQLSIRGTLCPEYFFRGASFQSWCIYLSPLRVINLTVLYLMLLLCVWSRLLSVGALSSPSLPLKRPQPLAALPTPACAGSLLLFHLIAADSV